MTLSLVGISIPNFWLGPLLAIVFAVELGWLPVGGRGTPAHLVLPAATLGAALAAILARMTRASLLEELREPYVLAARAKGVSRTRAVLHHALRNSLIPIVTILGLQFGVVLTGAVITETIFAWPGIGRLLIQSISFRDYPLVQGCVLLIAVTYVGVNLITDLTYGFLDPASGWIARDQSRRGHRHSDRRRGHRGAMGRAARSGEPGACAAARTSLSRASIRARRARARYLFARPGGGPHLAFVGLTVVGISSVVGVLLGAIAGYFGGWLDDLISRVIDVLLAFPGILLAIALVAVLGPSLANVVMALSVIGWVGYARLVRGQVLKAREFEFVQAARALGARTPRILFRHVIPTTMPAVMVQATLGMAGAILAEASLSFLGLGVQPPTPSWGTMLNGGRLHLLDAPHLTIFPGAAIAALVLGFNFLGDGLRDALDPKRYRA